MISFHDIMQVSKINGVIEYILVDHQGQIISQNIKHPEQMAKMVSVCLKNGLAIAKNRLKYLSFSRKTKNNIYVFPVGNCGLGVVKHQTMNSIIFTTKIIEFLNNLVCKQKGKYKEDS